MIAGFCREVLGPRPLVAGHDVGAQILLHAVASGRLAPSRLVLMPNRLHCRPVRPALQRTWKTVASAAAIPGLDRVLSHGARLASGPALGQRLSARADPAARDLVRHAFADVGGNGNLARSWARFARHWPVQAQLSLLDAYPRMEMPVLLLWADQDHLHPLAGAEEALDLLPDGQLRVLPSTGFLIAYDDPVGWRGSWWRSAADETENGSAQTAEGDHRPSADCRLPEYR